MPRAWRGALLLACGALLIAARPPQPPGAAQLAEIFSNWEARAPELLWQLAERLQADGPDSPAGATLVDTVRIMAATLQARGNWSATDLDRVLTVMLVNPAWFVQRETFRQPVAALLRRQGDASLSVPLRTALLEGLSAVPGVDFDLAESVAVAWGMAQRPSGDREHAASLRIDDDEPIESTVLVLTSPFVDAAEGAALVQALEALAPERDLLVLHDQDLDAALRGARSPRTFLLPTLGRPFTPWPRDTMILGRRQDGGAAILVRPNQQPGREEDSLLGRWLLAQLPAPVDARWRAPSWQTATVPFHNGQILLTEEEIWVSIHSLEEAILARLGEDRVPLESFATDAGIDRYLDAARAEAEALARLFGRRAAFVHDMPGGGDTAARRAALLRLGGGGGFDLDSLLTLVPARGGAPARALVADLQLGLRTLQGLPADDVATLRRQYGIADRVDAVAAIAGTSGSPRGAGLQEFLDAVAEHLASTGMVVARVPALLAPIAMLHDAGDLQHDDFLIGWNNVVLSATADGHLAEGFASGLPGIDAQARERFAAAGVTMHFLPALTGSVIRNGGYRCATNHLRGTHAALH